MVPRSCRRDRAEVAGLKPQVWVDESIEGVLDLEALSADKEKKSQVEDGFAGSALLIALS